MNGWKMYVPWRKLQPFLLVSGTLVSVFVVLQLLGLEIVSKNYRRPSPSGTQTAKRVRLTRQFPHQDNSRRQPNQGECRQEVLRYFQDYCEEIRSFNETYPTHIISTLDLRNETDYNLDNNGHYVFPEEFFQPDVDLGQYEDDIFTLEVFLVPFSHVDPGYGQTMEDYYKISVRSILDLMLEKLVQYRDLTFQWTETVFLERWFREISKDKKLQVGDLIARGQLEIVLGGWVMPDEALTDYRSVIGQLMEGHHWLKEQLGVQPTNAWINDPFGQSGTFPYLLKRAGIQNMVVQRVHQAVKHTLMSRSALEFWWRPYWKSNNANDIFCSVTPYETYYSVCGPIDSFCSQFDYLNLHSGKSKAVAVNDINVHRLATQLLGSYKFTAKLYKYQTLLVFIGNDNAFNVPKSWDNVYENYNKLITHVNAVPEFKTKIKFGTLQSFFQRLHTKGKAIQSRPKMWKTDLESDQIFPTLSGDFFPYSDNNNDYWTGFYSNRPWVKRLARIAEAMLRAADAFSAIAYDKLSSSERASFETVFFHLRSARRNISLYQHHDGITGTSFPHVIIDFQRRLLNAYQSSLRALKVSVATLILGEPGNADLLRETVEIKNTRSPITDKVLVPDSGKQHLTIVNPLLKARAEVVSVYLTKPNVRLKDADGEEIKHQISQKSKVLYLMSFVLLLKPFEIRTIIVEPYIETDEVSDVIRKYTFPHIDDEILLENEYIQVFVNSTRGSLQKICDKQKSQTCTVINSIFRAYRSKKSGAYVFGPSGNASYIDKIAVIPDVQVLKGPIVSEVFCDYGSGFTQTFRLFNVKGPRGQVLHVINKIELPTKKVMNNTEVIMRLETDINNDNLIFTDQNGFQIIGRVTDSNLPLEGNFYPITNMAILEDDTRRLTLHSSQSMGVASLKNGWLEVMLDRVMDHDDGKGLGMGIKDRGLTVTDFVIQIEYKPMPRPITEPKYIYPTVNSLLLNEQLQNNLIVFSNHDRTNKMTQFSTVSQTPCDLSLAVFRNVLTSNVMPYGTAVTLHRPAVCCDFPPLDLQCVFYGVMSNGNLLSTLGINLDNKMVQETLLTQSETIRTLDVCDNIFPSKNELISLLIS